MSVRVKVLCCAPLRGRLRRLRRRQDHHVLGHAGGDQLQAVAHGVRRLVEPDAAGEAAVEDDRHAARPRPSDQRHQAGEREPAGGVDPVLGAQLDPQRTADGVSGEVEQQVGVLGLGEVPSQPFGQLQRRDDRHGRRAPQQALHLPVGAAVSVDSQESPHLPGVVAAAERGLVRIAVDADDQGCASLVRHAHSTPANARATSVVAGEGGAPSTSMSSPSRIATGSEVTVSSDHRRCSTDGPRSTSGTHVTR